MAYTEEELKKELETKEYEYGFYTDIDSDTFPVGLSEEIVRAISKRKEEPEWMTEWRLDAYRSWIEMKEHLPGRGLEGYFFEPERLDRHATAGEGPADSGQGQELGVGRGARAHGG